MGTEFSKSDFEIAALELEAAAEMIEPYLKKLDDSIAYMQGREWGPNIPPEHRIIIGDFYDVHQSGERTFKRFLPLFPYAGEEWIESSLMQFQMTAAEQMRVVMREKQTILAKYAVYARKKASLPAEQNGERSTAYNFYGPVKMTHKDHSGDMYIGNTASDGAAIGRESAASKVKIGASVTQKFELPRLADELAAFRLILRAEASVPEHDIAIGDIAAAEAAARKGDASTVWTRLKSAGTVAGKFLLDIGTKVGAEMAVSAIRASMTGK